MPAYGPPRRLGRQLTGQQSQLRVRDDEGQPRAVGSHCVRVGIPGRPFSRRVGVVPRRSPEPTAPTAAAPGRRVLQAPASRRGPWWRIAAVRCRASPKASSGSGWPRPEAPIPPFHGRVPARPQATGTLHADIEPLPSGDAPIRSLAGGQRSDRSFALRAGQAAERERRCAASAGRVEPRRTQRAFRGRRGERRLSSGVGGTGPCDALSCCDRNGLPCLRTGFATSRVLRAIRGTPGDRTPRRVHEEPQGRGAADLICTGRGPAGLPEGSADEAASMARRMGSEGGGDAASGLGRRWRAGRCRQSGRRGDAGLPCAAGRIRLGRHQGWCGLEASHDARPAHGPQTHRRPLRTYAAS